MQISNNRDTTRTQAFTYDQLNRVVTAQTPNSSLWGNAYVYDAWGNLTNMNAIPGKTGGQNLQAAPASTKNQLPGFSYDAAGNLTVNGTSTYTYDAEDRIETAAGVTYTYDGDGVRVAKSNGRLYWYSSAGEMLTETDATGALIHEFVYLGGRRVGFINSAGNRYYYWSDHLGTANVVTNAQGAIKEESDFYPFGGERVITDLLDNRYKFTGKERDTESGLDYFGARYYTSNLGRFMTPDWAAKPVAVPYANYGNPQSLNLYSYVENNPTTMGDPDGHQKPDVKGSDDPNTVVAGNPLTNLPKEREKAQNSSTGDKIKSAWLTATSPIQKAADWADEHPLIVFPVAIAAALKGNEGPIEADEEFLAKEGSTLLESIQAHGRTILMAVKGSPEGEEALRYLDSMKAEANAGGPGQMHIILRPDASKATVLEEFLHGTQSKLGIIDRLGLAGAEKHVTDFMQRHAKLLGLE